MLLLDVYNTVAAQITDIDPGSTFENLKQNSAVVGMLYVVVVVQAGIIVKLWLKVEKLQEDRVADLKARLANDDETKKQIQELRDLHFKKTGNK